MRGKYFVEQVKMEEENLPFCLDLANSLGLFLIWPIFSEFRMFLMDCKSSLHLSNASRSFLLFTSVLDGGQLICSSPISRATNATGSAWILGLLAADTSFFSFSPTTTTTTLPCFLIPEVRRFVFFWYLEISWMMPDMQPIDLFTTCCWFSGRRAKESCLFSIILLSVDYTVWEM